MGRDGHAQGFLQGDPLGVIPILAVLFHPAPALSAHVVDELRVLVAPALDGAEQIEGIVDYREGLAGVVRLQYKSADVLGHGVVQLVYAVLPPEA